LKRTAVFLVFLIVVLLPAASAAERPARWTPQKWLHKAERISKAAVCASQAADALSSYRDSRIPGLHESNGFYTPGGRFSMGRMIGVKSGICAAFLWGSHFSGPSQGAALVWTTIGAGLTIPTAYAAIHNVGLK
jgi:hypothetical protein